MQPRNIVVVNACDYPLQEVVRFIQAMQTYLVWLGDFWPEVAGSTIRLGFASPGLVPLVLALNAEHAGTLGFHERTEDGLPTGTVEKAACDQYNWPWTMAGSHEVAELLINPELDQFVQYGNEWWPLEIGDVVTAERGLRVSDVELSNFSTPAIWGKPSAYPGRYDMLGQAAAPLPTLPHLGWTEYSSNGAWANRWGAAISLRPYVLNYLSRDKPGRRHRLRGTSPEAKPAEDAKC